MLLRHGQRERQGVVTVLELQLGLQDLAQFDPADTATLPISDSSTAPSKSNQIWRINDMKGSPTQLTPVQRTS